MRLHRFYIKGKKLAEIDVPGAVRLDSGDDSALLSLIHQWRDVFRYTVGSRVTLFDDSKTECLAMIETVSDSKANLVVLEKTEVPALVPAAKRVAGKALKLAKAAKSSHEQSGAVWLFAAIIKNDNFDFIIQKGTELGVDHVVPIISDRTIKKSLNMGRSQRIAIEASEQSGRLSVPQVHEPAALKEAMEDFLIMDGEAVVCIQGGEKWSKLKPRLKKFPLGFVIGPEGGWSDREVAYFKAQGFKTLALGNTVLRAEKAAISVLTLQMVE